MQHRRLKESDLKRILPRFSSDRWLFFYISVKRNNLAKSVGGKKKPTSLPPSWTVKHSYKQFVLKLTGINNLRRLMCGISIKRNHLTKSFLLCVGYNCANLTARNVIIALR